MGGVTRAQCARRLCLITQTRPIAACLGDPMGRDLFATTHRRWRGYRERREVEGTMTAEATAEYGSSATCQV